MGACQWPGDVVATWFRRSGCRTFIRPAGKIFAAMFSAQYAGLCAINTGANVSSVKTTNETKLSQTADRDDAKKFVAAQIMYQHAG